MTIFHFYKCLKFFRHLDEISKTINYEQENSAEQMKTRRLVKILERKRRKTAKIERKQRYIEKLIKENGNDEKLNPKESKYINCSNCKNPRNNNCNWGLCRMCCKDKVFADEQECKGHKLKFRIKNKDSQTITSNDDTKVNL